MRDHNRHWRNLSVTRSTGRPRRGKNMGLVPVRDNNRHRRISFIARRRRSLSPVCWRSRTCRRKFRPTKRRRKIWSRRWTVDPTRWRHATRRSHERSLYPIWLWYECRRWRKRRDRHIGRWVLRYCRLKLWCRYVDRQTLWCHNPWRRSNLNSRARSNVRLVSIERLIFRQRPRRQWNHRHHDRRELIAVHITLWR